MRLSWLNQEYHPFDPLLFQDELAAAVVSVRTHTVLRKALDYQDIKEVFWSDSKVVLGYICNNAMKFHILYIANQVQQIKDKTSSQQWKREPTDNNPADYAFRALHVPELIANKNGGKDLSFCGNLSI